MDLGNTHLDYLGPCWLDLDSSRSCVSPVSKCGELRLGEISRIPCASNWIDCGSSDGSRIAYGRRFANFRMGNRPSMEPPPGHRNPHPLDLGTHGPLGGAPTQSVERGIFSKGLGKPDAMQSASNALLDGPRRLDCLDGFLCIFGWASRLLTAQECFERVLNRVSQSKNVEP